MTEIPSAGKVLIYSYFGERIKMWFKQLQDRNSNRDLLQNRSNNRPRASAKVSDDQNILSSKE